MRLLYSLLWYALLPLLFARLWWRGRRAPAYRRRWRERLALGLGRGRLRGSVWIHAVSVGETLAAAPLIPFSKLGGFMIANIFFSALTAMVVLPASLATVGPPLRIGGAVLTGDLPRPWRRRGDAAQQPSPRPTEPSKVAPVFEVEA